MLSARPPKLNGTNARTVSRICRSSSVREKSTIARSSRTILESNSKIERPARPVKTAGSGPGRRPRPASLQLPAPAPSSTSPRWRAPALATVLFGSLRRTLAFDAAILRDLVRLPSGPPLRVASQRSVCLACQVGCVLLGGPPVATAAAGPVDPRLLGLVGRGLELGDATGGQRVTLPRSLLPRTALSWHRRRNSPGRPPERRGLAPAPAAAPSREGRLRVSSGRHELVTTSSRRPAMRRVALTPPDQRMGEEA